jgi:hypothetical protein
MTTDRLVQGQRAPARDGSDREQSGLPAATILAICDRLLGEVGRRQHMFGWLRAPGSSAEEWLAVDAYYPRARLVVICRNQAGPHDALYRELVPAHGLGLLTLNPAALGDDRSAVETALAAKIFDLEHVPRAAARPGDGRVTARLPGAGGAVGLSGPGTPADVAATAPADGSAWTPVKVERAAAGPALEQGVGLIAGLALAGVLIVEVYLDVAKVLFGAGRVVLAFAIALEACSRALGTFAAARAGERTWAGACAVGGSPVVAWFALASRRGGVEVEPAPLAGLLAVVAGVLALLALLIGS